MVIFLGLKLLKIIKISKNIPFFKVPQIDCHVALCIAPLSFFFRPKFISRKETHRTSDGWAAERSI